MFQARKNPEKEVRFKYPEKRERYVFNLEYPLGVRYNKDDRQVMGQRVKPGQYIMMDVEGYQYPMDPEQFNQMFLVKREPILTPARGEEALPGIAVFRDTATEHWRDFRLAEKGSDTVPLYNEGDVLSGGKYPINREIFEKTYIRKL